MAGGFGFSSSTILAANACAWPRIRPCPARGSTRTRWRRCFTRQPAVLRLRQRNRADQHSRPVMVPRSAISAGITLLPASRSRTRLRKASSGACVTNISTRRCSRHCCRHNQHWRTGGATTTRCGRIPDCGGLTPASISLAPCSPTSRPLRAGFAGDQRSVLTQAARSALNSSGRDGETLPGRTEKYRRDGRGGEPGLYF